MAVVLEIHYVISMSAVTSSWLTVERAAGVSALPWSYMTSNCFPYVVNPRNVKIATLDISAYRKN